MPSARLTQLRLLLLLPLLLLLADSSCAQQCTGADGSLLPPGYILPHPEDGCLTEVCRCASEDRCVLVTERRMLQIRVNGTVPASASSGSSGSSHSALAEAGPQMMQCRCIDHQPGSTDMDFQCTSPSNPGRNLGAKITGCLDFNGGLSLPNEKVTIQSLRGESLRCHCNSDGHYVDCLPVDDPGDNCLDTVRNIRVALKESYYRAEKNSRGQPIRLRCTCVRSDQETICTLA